MRRSPSPARSRPMPTPGSPPSVLRRASLCSESTTTDEAVEPRSRRGLGRRRSGRRRSIKTCYRALDEPPLKVEEAAHDLEHSIEIQLPFLEYVLPRPRFVPLEVGFASFDRLARSRGGHPEGDRRKGRPSDRLDRFLALRSLRHGRTARPARDRRDPGGGRAPALRHGRRARDLDVRGRPDHGAPVRAGRAGPLGRTPPLGTLGGGAADARGRRLRVLAALGEDGARPSVK